MEYLTKSPEDTFAFGEKLAQHARKQELFLLQGDLGAGKTTLTKGIASGLGIDPDEVTSPTFTLLMEHQGKKNFLYHFDLYRLSSPEELFDLGLEDYLDQDGVIIMEWGNRFEQYLTSEKVYLSLTEVGESERQIKLVSDSPHWKDFFNQ